jgi:hypothetical protein
VARSDLWPSSAITLGARSAWACGKCAYLPVLSPSGGLLCTERTRRRTNPGQPLPSTPQETSGTAPRGARRTFLTRPTIPGAAAPASRRRRWCSTSIRSAAHARPHCAYARDATRPAKWRFRGSSPSEHLVRTALGRPHS